MRKDEFMIGGWLAPKNTARDYMLAKECGLNTMYLLSAPAGWLGEDIQLDAVRICKEVGMDAIPVVNTRLGDDLVLFDERLYAYDNIPAVILWDEPSLGKFPFLVEKIEEFYKHWDKNVRCEINLYPSYTPPKALGTENYFEYVEKYVNDVHSKMPGANVFSLDFYPIFKREEGIVVTPMWLPCLSIMAHFSALKKLPTHCFIQTMPFAIGNDVVQTYELLRMQFTTYMAFGFRAFTHFCYASPGISEEFREHQEAVIGRNGEPSALYEPVRESNAFAQGFAPYYLPYTYVGTAKFAPNAMEDYEGWAMNYNLENTAVKSVEVDCPILVGAFQKEGGEAFFVTHFALPEKADGKCTLRLDGVRTLRLTKDNKTWETTTDTLDVTLEAGNGIFVEIIK